MQSDLADAPRDARVAAVASRQHGRIRVDQLMDCGLDDSAVARRVRKGHLHRVHSGVYAVGHSGATLHAHFMAAVLAGGSGAFLSHRSAAALVELVRWRGGRIDVTVRGCTGRARSGIRFHRSGSITPHDVTLHHGIPVVTPARALLEITPDLSDRRLKRIVRKAQAEGLASVEQIAEVVNRSNGHRGTKRLASVISTGPAPTYSGDEDVVLDLILDAGLQHPEVNRRLFVGTTSYYPDMRWPAQRVILEVDSAWHDGHLARAGDLARQADLESLGERVLRTTRDDAIRQPRLLIQRLIAGGVPLG